MDNSKSLKNKILSGAWGISVFQLIYAFLYYFLYLETFDFNKHPQTAIFEVIFGGLAILYALFLLIIPFAVCFISTIVTTYKVIKGRKVNGTYYAVNYIFQIAFLIIVWFINYNTYLSILYSIFSIIGMLISYIASKHIKQYNSSISTIE